MKALSIRLDDRLGTKFDSICRRTGYKKNTLVTRLIQAFVQGQENRTDQHANRSQRDTRDPFEKVIGIINQPIGLSADEIDKVIYGL